MCSLRNRLLHAASPHRGDNTCPLSWNAIQIPSRTMDPHDVSSRTADGLRDSDERYGGPGWTACDVGGEGIPSLLGALAGGMGCE